MLSQSRAGVSLRLPVIMLLCHGMPVAANSTEQDLVMSPKSLKGYWELIDLSF